MIRRRTISLGVVAALIVSFFVTSLLFAALINDGSFENRPSDWEEYYNTTCTAVSIGNWVSAGGPAAVDGVQTFWAGGACTNGIVANNGARQDITLEQDAALLSFWYYPIKAADEQNDDIAFVAFDETPVWTLDVDGISAPATWNNAIIEISQFAGQTTTISVEMQHDNDTDVGHVFFDYFEVFHPSLEINQELSPAVVFENDSFTVEITIENTGDTVLENLAVSNTSFASCDQSSGSLPDLNPGESTVYSCNVANATLGMENVADVQATTTSLNYSVEGNHTVSSFVINPSIALVVDPNDVSITQGQQIPFELSLTNIGENDLTNLSINSTTATNCNFSLGFLAKQTTAVFNCTYAPVSSETLFFSVSATEPSTKSEITTEAAVSIEVMPVLPPTVPVFNLYLPAAGKNLVSQDALGEPNDICQQSYPVSINEAGQFLAEDVDDWYRFTLNSTSDLTILLIDFAPVAGQITLWRGDCQNLVLIGQNGDFATQKSVNLTNQPPGEYHIWLINDGPLNATSKYTLLATTP